MDATSMLRRSVLSTGLLFLSFSGFAHSSKDGSDGVKKIYRFQLNDYALNMRLINSSGFDIAGVNLKQGVVDLVLNDEEMIIARNKLGLKLINMVEDSKLALDEKYHTASEVDAELHDFAARFSELAMVKSIGKSHEGRDIWAIKISDNVASDEKEEPSILFNAMHHAREVMTTEVAIDTINYLLTRYGDDPEVRGWVNNNEIWVVPMLNVDGNNKVWNGSSLWRKNTFNRYGVDLNRNYPYAWGSCNGSSPWTFSDTYRGPRAGSEPEAQALMGLVAQIRPVFNLSYHSYSEIVIYPFGCDGVRSSTTEVVENIGKKMASLLPSDNGNGFYTPGTSWETLYSVDGSDIDWMHHEYDVVPYVIEVNSTKEGFQPNFNDWREKTVTKMRSAWQMLLNRASESGIRGTVNLNSGRLAEKVTAKIDAISQPQLSARTHKLSPDGTFHVVLTPGTYSVTISDGQNTLAPETVVVDERLSNVSFDF